MYDKRPYIEIQNEFQCTEGYESIGKKIIDESKSKGYKKVVLDIYPGLDAKEIVESFFAGDQVNVIYTDEFTVGTEKYKEIIKFNVTDDRLFGVNSFYDVSDFFLEDATKKINKQINESVTNIIIGVGASELVEHCLLVYLDITRWEIRTRHQKNQMGNWLMNNKNEDPHRKYKIGFFVEWKFGDKHKKKIYHDIDYYIDMNNDSSPLMVSATDYRKALKNTSERPFRLVPFFDSSVWGGQWMKEELKLDPSKENYGWSFMGVPDENSLLYKFDSNYLEIPAGNLIDQYPKSVLGDIVYSRFGSQFPIRFNYLDTVGGENLSLQVHPTTDYIQETFGMPFTQDESYYIMDAGEDSIVYLGLKNNINKEEMFLDLQTSQNTGRKFNNKKYVNEFSVKKHDHILIPGGTVHSSGSNTVVLEISATIDLFTFKLWDWDRLGLDGQPRPINLKHGKPNVLTERDKDFCENELINNIDVIKNNENYKLEKTGLHELEYIETHRHTIKNKKTKEIYLKDSVSIFTVVDGKEIKVKFGKKNEMIINYAETFIVPESCKKIEIENLQNEPVIIIEAFVR